MRLVAVGYSTVEAIPLYHVSPGGSSLRLVVAGGGDLGIDCDWVEVCSIARASMGEGVEVSPARVAGYASRWRADVVMLDGIEPLQRVGRSSLGQIAGKTLLGARSQDPLEADTSLVSFMLVDHVEPLGGRVPTHRLVMGIERLKRVGVHVEVATYLEEPRYEEIIPLVEAVGEYPLHVYIRDPRRGLPSFIERLSRRVPYAYIHAGPHSRLDTTCPQCGAVLATRSEGALQRAILKGPVCPRCGARVPVLGRVYESTPSRLYVVSRGGTEWIHPARLG